MPRTLPGQGLPSQPPYSVPRDPPAVKLGSVAGQETVVVRVQQIPPLALRAADLGEVQHLYFDLLRRRRRAAFGLRRGRQQGQRQEEQSQPAAHLASRRPPAWHLSPRGRGAGVRARAAALPQPPRTRGRAGPRQPRGGRSFGPAPSAQEVKGTSGNIDGRGEGGVLGGGGREARPGAHGRCGAPRGAGGAAGAAAGRRCRRRA